MASTNLQLQIDELKTTDGILCSDSVIRSLGLGESTCSDALIYLDASIKQLIDSIVNMYNFIKTGDYHTAGTFSHTVKGNAAKAILVGGGGGGGGGGTAKRYSHVGGGGGGGGGGGVIIVTDIIAVNKNTTYPVIVGKKGTGGTGAVYGGNSPSVAATRGVSGGTSSVFSVTAPGGSGGSNSTSSANPSSGNGVNGSGDSRTLELTTISCGSGGGGGTGGDFHNMVGRDEYTNGQVAPSYPGGSGAYGSGNGGSSGTAKYIYTPAQSQYPTTWYNTWIYSNAGDGNNATSYGSGGGGGGGTYYGLPNEGENNNQRFNIGHGGSGGDGKDGRVVIYERGIFQN